MYTEYLDIDADIAHALAHNQPVVALESTIISHGMPYPQNMHMALQVEQIVRDNGAVPATIALMDGTLKVGLGTDHIQALAQSGKDTIKVSRRDIPFVIACKSMGATTVASTMIIAHMAGIKFFATGGIGGVHRGAEKTFDISADLQQLAQTDVAVICAGAKSILDLGLTLEYLETQGVPVIGYGTDSLPAFYTRTSDFSVDYRFDTPIQVAQALRVKWQLNVTGGVVIANPIPEAESFPASEINTYIATAVHEAQQQGIKGKDTTPFLLARVCDLSAGKSLRANTALVYNNAKIASQIAVQYFKNI